MTLRTVIVLPSGGDPWRQANLSRGFAAVAGQLVQSGFEVELIVPPGDRAPNRLPIVPGAVVTSLAYSLPAIVAGPASASMTASLKLGHQLWRRLSADPPDIVIAPLAGGVLQPCLMSRALGESLEKTCFIAWGEATTAQRIGLGDIELAGPAAVVDEALEDTTLRLVDAIASPRSGDAHGDGNYRLLQLALPGNDNKRVPRPPSRPRIDEIVYLGPASARHGTPQFLEALERLDRAGRLGGRRVTFLGPWREGPMGLGKAMLGRRARDWRFPFTQIDEAEAEAILNRIARPGILAISPGAAPDDDSLLAEAINIGASLAICAHHPLAERLADHAWVCASDLSDLDHRLDENALISCQTSTTGLMKTR